MKQWKIFQRSIFYRITNSYAMPLILFIVETNAAFIPFHNLFKCLNYISCLDVKIF